MVSWLGQFGLFLKSEVKLVEKLLKDENYFLPSTKKENKKGTWMVTWVIVTCSTLKALISGIFILLLFSLNFVDKDTDFEFHDFRGRCGYYHKKIIIIKRKKRNLELSILFCVSLVTSNSHLWKLWMNFI